MSEKIHKVILGVCLVLAASFARSAEYDDADILPQVTKIQFTSKYVGLLVEGIGQLEKPAFILDRSRNQFRAATENEFSLVFGESTEVLPNRMRHAEPPFVTTDGTPYVPYRCHRYDGPVAQESEMIIADRQFPIDFEYCLHVSEIEIVEDIVWIGTFQAGDHGAYGGVGLVAASYDTGRELGRIDTGRYPISHVRADPFSDNVWAITTDRLVEVRDNLEVESTYVFYYDFDSDSQRPEAMIAGQPVLSHPLAVFARSLSAQRHEEFYEAVQTIPENVARSFDLYNVYMCCTFLREGEPSSEPAEFEILIPFLLSGFEHGLSRWHYGSDLRTRGASRSWRQIACKHRNRNEQSEALCVTEDWADLLGREME